MPPTITGNFGMAANNSSRSPASWGRSTAHLSCSTGTSGHSVREPTPAWAAYWSPCAKEPLPPIEVWAWHGEYYVLDGHHRVAAARAVGSDYISAHVVEVG
jgi:hypothetical protein